MTDTSRNIKKTDKFLRDTIVVTAHARNIGLWLERMKKVLL